MKVTDKLPLGGYGRSTRLAFTGREHGHFVTTVGGGTTGRATSRGERDVDQVGAVVHDLRAEPHGGRPATGHLPA